MSAFFQLGRLAYLSLVLVAEAAGRKFGLAAVPLAALAVWPGVALCFEVWASDGSFPHSLPRVPCPFALTHQTLPVL